MIKVPAKLHFSLETGAAVSFKSGQLFQRAEKKFAETYFLKIVFVSTFACLACMSCGSNPHLVFSEIHILRDFLLIIYFFCSSYIFFDNSIFICNVCTFEVGSDQIVTLLKRKKGFEIFVFWFLCAPLTLSLLEKHLLICFLETLIV